MRYAIQFRALIEVDADTEDQAVARAREHVYVYPGTLKVAGILEAPLHHGERQPDPAPPPAVNRAHYREGGRPVMRDRRGA